jgi:hypothetical protein
LDFIFSIFFETFGGLLNSKLFWAELDMLFKMVMRTRTDGSHEKVRIVQSHNNPQPYHPLIARR